MTTPLPCPFCGHPEIAVVEGSTFRWLLAECQSCGASGPEVRVQTIGPGSPDEWRQAGEADALSEWNTRITTTTP
jgi:Lar family restriction alleviation protein